MFFLKKIAVAFITPPGIFIIVFISIGIVLSLRKKWLVSSVIWLVSLTAWAISTAPLTDVIMNHVESGINIPKSPSGDVIIVLGAGIHRSMPDITGIGTLTEKTAYRLLTAYRLHKELKLPILFSGAGNSSDVQPVRSIVFRILNDMGVPVNRIIVEDQSRDTKESAEYVARICSEKGFKNPILVSSAYHLKRAVYCFGREGIDTTPFPAGFQSWEGKKYTWLSYLPGNYGRFSIALKEILGLKIYHLMDRFQRA